MSRNSGAVAETPVVEGAASHEFVTFLLDQESYAVPVDAVRTIVRLSPLTPVPLALPTLSGLMNLRGTVLPVADLRQCCGLPSQEVTAATRVLVVDAGSPVGLVVDRVVSVRKGAGAVLDAADQARSAIGADLLAGVLHDGDHLTSVLDLDRLTTRELRWSESPDAASTGRRGSSDPVRDEAAPRAGALQRRLVTFLVAGQEYALELDSVHEIARSPVTPTAVPRAVRGVLGMVDLRGGVLPVFGLRTLLGLESRPLDPGQRLLVVTVPVRGETPGGAAVRVGLVADSVREVLRVDDQDCHPVPESITDGVEALGVTEICRLEEGRRLVSVLSLVALVGEPASELAEAGELDVEQGGAPMVSSTGNEEDPDRLFVGFRVGASEYGMDVEDIQGVARVPAEIVELPDLPGFVAGLANVRGEVLPVIDLGARLGGDRVTDRGTTGAARILVTAARGQRFGLLVDAVVEVRRVRSSSVLAPDAVTDSRLVAGLVLDEDDDTIMLVLDRQTLVSVEDGVLLAADGAA